MEYTSISPHITPNSEDSPSSTEMSPAPQGAAIRLQHIHPT